MEALKRPSTSKATCEGDTLDTVPSKTRSVFGAKTSDSTMIFKCIKGDSLVMTETPFSKNFNFCGLKEMKIPFNSFTNLS